MSRAFVKENDLEHAGIDIPERPISSEINYVTPFGLDQISEKLSMLDKDRDKFLGEFKGIPWNGKWYDKNGNIIYKLVYGESVR